MLSKTISLLLLLSGQKKEKKPFSFKSSKEKAGVHVCAQMANASPVSIDGSYSETVWAAKQLSCVSLSSLVAHLFVECRKAVICYVKKCEMKLFFFFLEVS